MGYGQHQSFYLRDRWLPKAIKEIDNDERFFYDKFAFEKIGLGKNMVQSLRYWSLATNVIGEDFTKERQKFHFVTAFGKILNKYDKSIQLNESASLLHYFLSKQKEPSTVFYWYFNELDQNIISKEDLLGQFIEWVEQNETKEISLNSLKKDIDCLIKLYTAGLNSDDPEEVIQSPLSKIHLIKENKNTILKSTPSYEEIGLLALMYTLLDYCIEREDFSLTVDQIYQEKGLWGKIFNLSRIQIVGALEQLSYDKQYGIKFVRTNQLDTVQVPQVNPLTFLDEQFQRKIEAFI
ncbi:DUF4007 family protein [Fictibacillus sp. B-59209]|uniref:DUF4007 family protein n=1 Tax=Fictibacillus sp. B-59209 TaxID=3024873 RepID=UPI002E20B0CD|nr:DUF4007 family protein [Fictibacillus sp. B-59209]